MRRQEGNLVYDELVKIPLSRPVGMFTFHHRLRLRFVEGTTKSGDRSKGIPRPQYLGAEAGPTKLVTSQKVWVGGEKELDKIERVWYEQDG